MALLTLGCRRSLVAKAFGKKGKGTQKITRAPPRLQEGLHERVGARYARSNPTPLCARPSLTLGGHVPPEGGSGFYSKRKEKLQALYIIYDITPVFLTIESRKKPSTLQNFDTKNLSFSTQKFISAYMCAQSKIYFITVQNRCARSRKIKSWKNLHKITFPQNFCKIAYWKNFCKKISLENF